MEPDGKGFCKKFSLAEPFLVLQEDQQRGDYDTKEDTRPGLITKELQCAALEEEFSADNGI